MMLAISLGGAMVVLVGYEWKYYEVGGISGKVR